MDQQVSNPVGRPTVITEGAVSKLIAVLERGHSISTACQFAKIGRKAFYERYNKDTEFRNKIEDAKQYAKLLAGSQIYDVLQDITRNGQPARDEQGNILKDDKGNVLKELPKYNEKTRVNTAKWYLENKEPEEFGKNNRLPVGNQNNTQNNYFFASDEQFRQFTNTTGIKDISEEELIEVITSPDVERSDTEEALVELHQ